MAASGAASVSLVCVDDDPLMLEFIERRLRNCPNRFRCFTEPAAAIEFLEDNEVQTILVDQRMPLMGGLEFLQELADRGCNDSARKVLCSAVAADADARAYAGALGAETLEKDRIRDRETLLQLLG